MHVGCQDFLVHGLGVLKMDESIIQLDYGDFRCRSVSDLRQLFGSGFSRQNVQQLRVDMNCLSWLENLQANRGAFIIQFRNCLFGVCLLTWNSESNPRVFNDTNYKQCRLVGSGMFPKPINITVSKIQVQSPIHHLPKCCLWKMKKGVTFDVGLEHKIGFVCTVLLFLLNGDLKWEFCELGMKGAAANYRCPWCLSAKQDQVEKPHPNTRCWASRTVAVAKQGSALANSGVQTNTNLQLGYKRHPFFVAGFENIAIPTLHVNLGVIHNVFIVFRAKIQYHNADNQTLGTYHSQCTLVQRLETTTQNHQLSLQWLDDHERSEILELDVEFDMSIPEIKRKLRQAINKLEKQLTDARTKCRSLEEKLQQDNSQWEFLKLCESAQIKPWHIKNGSMVGIAGKNFLKHRNIFLKALKKRDMECYKLAKPLLARLNFWCSVTWTKHLKTFDDRILKVLKWNLLELDWLYHKWIPEYGGGQGAKYGIKMHIFYHILEWCRGTRLSPAESDDERVEAWNQYIARFAPIFQCFGGKVNLEKLINKLWRRFVMNWNASNTNTVYDGVRML